MYLAAPPSMQRHTKATAHPSHPRNRNKRHQVGVTERARRVVNHPHEHRLHVSVRGSMYAPRVGVDDAQQLGGFLKKLTKAITKPLQAAAKPLLKVQSQIHKAVIKVAPKPLKSILTKVSASAERATQATLVPTTAPAMLKAELQQVKETAQSPAFKKLAAVILAGAAIYFTGGAATGAVLKLLQAAAERAAARKAAAQSQAEVDAAQAEFDAYAKQLAQQQAQAATAGTPSTAIPAMPGVPTLGPPLVTQYGAAQFAPQGFDAQGNPVALAPQSATPPWLIPAAIGAAALVAIPLLSRGSTQPRSDAT